MNDTEKIKKLEDALREINKACVKMHHPTGESIASGWIEKAHDTISFVGWTAAVALQN